MRLATLTLLTLLGLVAGAFYGGYVLHPQNPIDKGHWTFAAGDLLLIRPMLLVGLPLVLVCVVAAAGRIRAHSRFGLAMGALLAWFAIMMIVSASIGASVAVLLQPGELPADVRAALLGSAPAQYEASPAIAEGIQEVVDARQETLAGAWLAILRRALPGSLIAELGAGRILGLIVLAMLLGLGLAATGERGRAALTLFEALQSSLLRAVRWISWIAPLGVFLLVANAAGSMGLDAAAGAMRRFGQTLAAALAGQAVIVLPVALLVFGRCNPIALAWRSLRALAVAFVSASTMAALPAAIDSAIDSPEARPRRNGRPSRSACSSAAASLVLPLGATLNLNGTAIYQAAAVVFMCQVHGIMLETSDLVVIILTAVIAALSTAGVAGAGLVTLIIVIASVNTSLTGRGAESLSTNAIGMLIAVDRALDMCRTVVNVWGNLVAARVITQIAPDEMGATNDELRMANAGAAARPL